VRRIALLVPISLILAACGGGGAAIPKEALGKLVLAPRDVPALRVFDAGRQVTLDNPVGPRRDPSRYGREGGWKARYRRPGTRATEGPLVVESRADLFSSSSGAKRDLRAYEDEFTQTIASAPRLRRRLAPPAGLGDEALAMRIRQPGAAAVEFFRIAWREHNATASVLVEGFEGKVAFADAVVLARRQEAHLRAAAH
jgi:hypothetical protein